MVVLDVLLPEDCGSPFITGAEDPGSREVGTELIGICSTKI